LINNSHRLGLAQLYQIRGRVGRSNRQAYAYLLIRRRPPLSPQATKRLKTIERHSALGSGYAIALRDLEIRGTGNIFGLEQSGHVAALGLDLYTRIIQDVIKERDLSLGDSSFERLHRDEITIRIFPGARIPDSFIPDPHLRLNLYRRIVALGDDLEIRSFSAELQDRFGAPPEEVKNLLLATELRLLASHLGVRSITLSSAGQLLLDFAEPADSGALLERIQQAMQASGAHYRFSSASQGSLRVSIVCDSRSAYCLAKDTFLALTSG
jgi:transcription-repair coupling factor (superfamily II helicase)